MDSAIPTNQQVQTLYEQCDPGGRGYITRGDLNCLQGHVPLDDAQLDELFAILDKGQQGQLTLEEFTKGFETELCAEHGFLNPGQFLGQTVKPLEMITAGESEHDSDTQLDQVMQATGAGILLKDYNQVGRIWKELRQSNPSLLPEFEKMLASIATEIRTARTEYENMESMIRTKLNRQEEHLGQLLEDLEQQMTQERERLLEEERSKERKLRETLANELRQKENMSNELLQQYEQARTRLDELEKTRMETIQEKDRLQQEKVKLEKCLADKESALNECKEYIEMLQKKAREDRRTRAKAAIELSENIALEREDLVRQLDTLRLINQKLVDDREERRQRYLSRAKPQASDHHKLSKDDSLEASSPLNSEREVESDGDPNRMSEGSVNCMPEWASLRVSSHTVSNRGTEDARRGSVLGAYFNSGPDNGSTETELEGIAETDEDEDVFSSDNAQESRVKNLVLNPTAEDQQKLTTLQNEKPVSDTNDDSLFQRYKIAQRVYKVMFIGDTAVGKSSIIQQLVSGQFDPKIGLTVAIDFRTKVMHCDDDTDIILQLWDTAGQEKYRGITWKYFRRADAVVVVYDVTRESSLISVRKWVQSVRDGADEDVFFMILSNKHDQFDSLEDQKKLLMRKSFQELIKNYSAIGFEVSAVTGENIQRAFLELARLLKTKEDDRLTNLIELGIVKSQTKKKGCCGR
ncbi:Ras and EF-hand domain-containing protein [Fasciola hepatica]|uniref:Ras and EF-hand domain-containing protein n=1 Tax=Fasciola hepatica TaxID=6192 RepID=A0A4E0RVY3_FASHE|nr:Ras and EF-hand domain-containing protein [Fasciola hepatica]